MNKLTATLIGIIAVLVIFIVFSLSSSTLLIATISYILGTIIG